MYIDKVMNMAGEQFFEEAEKYMYGKEVKCNYTKAVELYTAAAEEGNLRAMHKLAVIYRDGEIVIKDDEKALFYFEKCAETGDNASLFRLAVMYRNGEIAEKDTAKAKELYLKAAQQGFDKAQNNLGTMYKEEGNFTESAYWYKQAKNQGNEAAAKNLENMLEYNADAIYALACDATETEAEALFEKAAKLNHSAAIKKLADIKASRGEEAESLYIRAAGLGDTESAEILGDMYFEKSLKIAEKYYKTAAEKSESAARKLAACYTDDRRIFKKKAKAEKILENLR